MKDLSLLWVTIGPGRGRFNGREAEPKFLARPLDRSACFEAIEGGIAERLVSKANVILINRYKNFVSSQGQKLIIC